MRIRAGQEPESGSGPNLSLGQVLSGGQGRIGAEAWAGGLGRDGDEPESRAGQSRDRGLSRESRQGWGRGWSRESRQEQAKGPSQCRTGTGSGTEPLCQIRD